MIAGDAQRGLHDIRSALAEYDAALQLFLNLEHPQGIALAQFNSGT